MKRPNLQNRLKHLEARQAFKQSRNRAAFPMNPADVDASLAKIDADLNRGVAEDAALRDRIGDEAFAAVMRKRELEWDREHWNWLQGRFPPRPDLHRWQERLSQDMCTEFATEWKRDHETAGTWPAVVTTQTALDAQQADE